MTRPLKFRIWDGKEMRLLDQQFVGVGQIGFSDTHWVDLSEHDAEDVQVMQFTGLKDKNGVDTFHHDMLLWINWRREGTAVPDVYLIEWDSDKACFYLQVWRDGKHIDDSNIWDSSMEDFEVVGNVYETPKLLEAKS